MIRTITNPPSERVKHTLASMTLDEKLGQLITSRNFVPDIKENITKGIVGNLYVSNETPPEKIQELQSLAKIPMMICADLEAGCVHGGALWPTALTLAALDAETALTAAYKWSYYQGLEARKNGINVVYGPVLDVILNQRGIMTGTRTLGENPVKAANLAVQVVKGYQDAGVLPFPKHFPGFGRGWEDAHFELSTCDADRETLFKEDLLPYIQAVKEAGLAGVMTGHVWVDSVDKDAPMPLSKKVFALLDEIGFQGLTITDSLAMKSLTLEYSSSVTYPGCLAAGHDLLLTDYFVRDSDGLEMLKKNLADGILTEDMINRKAERVLKIKEYLANFSAPSFDIEEHKTFFREISEKSITFWGDSSFKPLPPNGNLLFIVVSPINANVQGELPSISTELSRIKAAIAEKYPNSEVEVLPEYPNSRTVETLLYKCTSTKLICFIGVADQGAYRGTAHYSRPMISLVSALRKKICTIVSVGNPFAVLDLPKAGQTLLCYNGGAWIESLVKVLAGEIVPSGKLPVTLEKKL
jgi:beta-N-acetylhexosaminidase